MLLAELFALHRLKLKLLLLSHWGCGWALGSSCLCLTHLDPGHTREVNRVESQRLWPAGEGKTPNCCGTLVRARGGNNTRAQQPHL